MRRRRLSALVLVSAVLAATVLAAVPASAGGGCHQPPTEGRGSTLAVEGMCFSPTVLRVDPGSELRVVNRDPIDHPTARPGGAWSWTGEAGGQTTIRLDRSGVYPFFCHVHPSMVAVVVVGDGSGTGAGVVQVDADTAGQPARAATGPAGFPAAWMVLVALAALVGAAAGTRLRGKQSA